MGKINLSPIEQMSHLSGFFPVHFPLLCLHISASMVSRHVDTTVTRENSLALKAGPVLSIPLLQGG